jgi:hypothetical protein
LSESQIWGAGEILGRDTVRFEYDYRDWRHVVTWTCQECAEVAGTAMPSSSAYVGVSLTLEFAEPISGVSGFVIVPSESARQYAHNAPLPKGAVQGVAWETSSTEVAMATNRNNGLLSGRRYVVFLAWPRETLPVAVLDLPPLDRDYTSTLSATLDGATVIERLGVPADGSAEIYPQSFPGYPAADAAMPSILPAEVSPESPGGSSSGQPPDSGVNSRLRDFVDTVNELGKAFDGLRQLGKKGRGAGGAETPPSPPSPGTYPADTVSSSDGTPAYSSDYSAYPPAPNDAQGPSPDYGTPSAWPTAEPSPSAPRCNPQIPKYSQPGCIE